MSVRVMAEVFEASLNPTEKLVLLAMADHADDRGGSIFPGNKRLAWKCGYSTRTVVKVQQELQSLGILKKVRDAVPEKGLANEWKIEIDSLPVEALPNELMGQ